MSDEKPKRSFGERSSYAEAAILVNGFANKLLGIAEGLSTLGRSDISDEFARELAREIRRNSDSGHDIARAIEELFKHPLTPEDREMITGSGKRQRPVTSDETPTDKAFPRIGRIRRALLWLAHCRIF